MFGAFDAAQPNHEHEEIQEEKPGEKHDPNDERPRVEKPAKEKRSPQVGHSEAADTRDSHANGLDHGDDPKDFANGDADCNV